MKIQSLYFSDGNMYIGGVSHIGYQSLSRLDCLQIVRKSLFSLKNNKS